MELGISMFGDISYDSKAGTFGSAGQRLRELIEEIKLMDEVGIDYFGIGEHHRPDYAVSSPEIILAAAATVTRNIRLGSAVSVLSSADPVKLYQNFAQVDLISRGRAEIMAGRGSFIESFPLFGYALEDYDALFTEKLDLLLRISREDPISWQGRFRPSLNQQKVLPRAGKDGRLPIWVAVGGTPQSVVRAGQLGLPLMIAIIGGAPVQFQPLFDLYRDTYTAAGYDPDQLQVGIHAHAFFGAEAAILKDYYPLYAAQMDRIGRTRGWPPYQQSQFEYGMSRNGALFMGSPAAMVDKILYMRELFGLTRFAAHMDVGAPDHTELMKSIEIYGTKIIPEIRKALADEPRA